MTIKECIDIVDNFKARHRNLTKDEVRIISERKGVIGINLWEKLLGNDDNSFDAVLRHMSEIIEIGGEDVIAMGTDFDGCDINPDLAGIEKIQALSDYLSAHGFDDRLLDKVFFSNADRFFSNLLFTK